MTQDQLIDLTVTAIRNSGLRYDILGAAGPVETLDIGDREKAVAWFAQALARFDEQNVASSI
jgi:hypothetical protein